MFRLISIFCCFVFFVTSCQKGKISEYSEYLNHNDTVKYVGKEQCRVCHAEIYDSYVQTGMGRSFNHAIKQHSALYHSNMDVIKDTLNNLSYKPFWKNDSLYILEFRIDGVDTVHKFTQKIHYKIGSGNHTNSHIYSHNDFLYQVPYTFYTQDSVSDLPPGFENGLNSRFTRQIGLECMSCHNAHSDHDYSSLKKYSSVPDGIDCERCHGPGELHVQQKLAGVIVDTSKYIDYSIVNPSKLSQDLQFDVCQRCHLQGTSVLKGSYSYEDFKPGMHLEEVMDVYLPRYKNNDKFLMASHVERLKQSSCFKNDDLSCTTCHNPHKSVKKLSSEYFDNKCMSCHIQCNDNHVNECSSCHMPKSNSVDIMHVSITDHKISIPHNNFSNDEDVFLGLKSINNDNPTNLSIAKAYLKHFESFDDNPLLLDSAIYYLNNAKYDFVSKIKYFYLVKDDKSLIDFVFSNEIDSSNYSKSDLAMTYAKIGEVFSRNNLNQKSEQYFLLSMKLMPNVIEYELKYATSLIKHKKLDKALKILEISLSKNKTYKQIYLNMGYIFLLKKEYVKAEIYFNKAISLDPDYIRAYENLLLLNQLTNNLDQVSLYSNKISKIVKKN